MNILSATRNIIHNNGIFFSYDPLNSTLKYNYKGEEYIFRDKKPLKISWQLLIFLLKK